MSKRRGARRGTQQRTAIATQSETVAEMIGRVAMQTRYTLYGVSLSVDWTRPDYAYWNRLHRGKLAAVRLGGLFAKPMVEHVRSWALGGKFTAATGHAATDEALADFVRQHMRIVLATVGNMLKRGDAYIVVNADGTLTQVSPELVEIVPDELDYRKIVAYKITTRLDKATIVDEYRAYKRTVTITLNGIAGTPQVFRNLTGRIPVVHFAWERDENEMYGHPMVEPLLPAMMEYDDVLDKSLKGVKAMGTPFPVIEGVANVEKTLNDLRAQTTNYDAADGTTKTGETIDLGTLDMFVTDGQFNLKGPNPFTDDSWRVLKNLFLLFLQHGNIPEWVWGGAIASSKASVEAQMPAFSKFIEAVQEALSDPLGALCEIWLGIVALYTRKLRALPVSIGFPPVAIEDKAEQRERVKQASDKGLITSETELRLLDLGIEDVDAEVKAARAEADERRKQAADEWALTPDGAQQDEDGAAEADEEAPEPEAA